MSTAKVVLITGCSKGGIGFSLAEEFAARGCIVYASARRLEAMEGFAHAGIHRLKLDVTHDESVRAAVDGIVAAEGRLDIVVNNAGVICIGAAIDVPPAQVQTTFDTNVLAPLRVARTVIPHMAARRRGLIMNVGSIVGEIPTPWNGVYSASKAALHSLTEVLAMECRPFNVKVMLVSPGAVRSNIAANQEQLFVLPPDSLYKAYLSQIVRRMHISQGPNAMPTAEFARILVDKALRREPPAYVMLGGNTGLYKVLKWVPRSFALWLIWRMLSK